MQNPMLANILKSTCSEKLCRISRESQGYLFSRVTALQKTILSNRRTLRKSSFKNVDSGKQFDNKSYCRKFHDFGNIDEDLKSS